MLAAVSALENGVSDQRSRPGIAERLVWQSFDSSRLRRSDPSIVFCTFPPHSSSFSPPNIQSHFDHFNHENHDSI